MTVFAITTASINSGTVVGVIRDNNVVTNKGFEFWFYDRNQYNLSTYWVAIGQACSGEIVMKLTEIPR